ncbi:MAG: RDD family protein [Acidobacteriota bacterium]|nr:RDD family protein [Acidobacteriota bacterium]
MNRRLAERKNRKDASVSQPPAESKSHLPANSRGAQAAARVAARYAKAPSFNEMQTAEARMALRAAETATRAALEAQAVAQMALAQLEVEPEEEGEAPFLTEAIAHPEILESARPTVKFEADAQVYIAREREFQHEDLRYSSGSASEENEPKWNWEEFGRGKAEQPPAPSVNTVEPVQSIHANLIEFPREIVATRRVRPHIAGEAVDSAGQLSIFEVDPGTISTVPETPAEPADQDSSWQGPEWSGIELDEQPEFEHAAAVDEAALPLQLDLAPWNLRLMASLVDFALIVGVLCAAVAAAARFMHPALSMRTSEIVGAILLAGSAAAYHWYFLVKRRATPGMHYAGISLCTFEDERPTEEQLRARFVATLLSVVPMGLGLAWAIFDDDHLSWHDRLSRTYQRRF